MKKILYIGQLPKEVGGSYTTGIAKVVYELSKQKVEGFKFFTYSTNIKNKKAQALCHYPDQYSGYSFSLIRIVKNILTHPIDTFQQWKIYKYRLHKNPLRFEFYKANFQEIIERVKPDLIHMHSDGLTPLYFARGNNPIPILYTCHGVFERYVDKNSQAKLYADYLTGLTCETHWEINNFYCCTDDSKIRIIPNGVDCAKFYFSSEERMRVRQELNVADNIKVFITVASVQERKGQLTFIKMMEKIFPMDIQYWIIGLGPDIEIIERYCMEHNLDPYVKLLGYKNSEELYRYYSGADIYVHSSTMEGQALCEIEAFSTGLRVIVRNLIKGTISDDELSVGDYFTLDFDNPDIMELKEWINKPNSETRSSRSNLDWAEVAKKYCGYYREIIQ